MVGDFLLANEDYLRRLPHRFRDVFGGLVGALLAPVGKRRLVAVRRSSLSHMAYGSDEPQSN